MQVQKVRQEGESTWFPGCIECTCYDRLVFWVCPDPRDAQRAAAALEQYNMGCYVEKETRYITEDQYKAWQQ
jgi:hypothetical protein